jgi:hypothetical protein
MSKKKIVKADAIREVLLKYPDFNAAETKECLAKNGIQITSANFYDTKSRMMKKIRPGKPLQKSKSKNIAIAKARRVVQNFKINQSIPEAFELEMLRRDNQKSLHYCLKGDNYEKAKKKSFRQTPSLETLSIGSIWWICPQIYCFSCI